MKIPGGNIKVRLKETKNKHFSNFTEPAVSLIYSPPFSIEDILVSISPNSTLQLKWTNSQQSQLAPRETIDISLYNVSVSPRIHTSFVSLSGLLTSHVFDISYGIYYNIEATCNGIGGRSSIVSLSQNQIVNLGVPEVEYQVSDSSISFIIPDIEHPDIIKIIQISEYSDFRTYTSISGTDSILTANNLVNGLKYWYRLFYKTHYYEGEKQLIGPLVSLKDSNPPKNIQIAKYYKDSIDIAFSATIYEDYLFNIKPVYDYEITIIKYNKLEGDVYYEINKMTKRIRAIPVGQVDMINSTNDDIQMIGNINSLELGYYYTLYVSAVLQHELDAQQYQKYDFKSDKVLIGNYIQLKKNPPIDFQVELDPYDNNSIRVWWSSDDISNSILQLYINTETSKNIIDISRTQFGYGKIYNSPLIEINKKYMIAAVTYKYDINEVKIYDTEITKFKEIELKENPLPPTTGEWEYCNDNPEGLRIYWSGTNCTTHIVELTPINGEKLRYTFENDNDIIVEGLLLNVRYSICIFSKNTVGVSRNKCVLNDVILGLPKVPLLVSSNSAIINNDRKTFVINIQNDDEYAQILDDFDYPIKYFNVYIYNQSMNMITFNKAYNKEHTISISSIYAGTLHIFIEAMNDIGGFYKSNIRPLDDSRYVYKYTMTV